MSLPARQQRVLNAIERTLEARDARMTALFSMFTRLARADEPVSAECLPRWESARWRRTWRETVLPVIPVAAALVLATGLVLAVALHGTPACAATIHPAPGSRSAVSCAVPPSLPLGK